MNTYQLLFGMAIFVYGTLYEVIHRIWIPTAEPDLYTHTTKSQRRHKKTKGKRGKPQHKVAAPRKIGPVKPSPQTLAPQEPRPTSPPSPLPKSVASVASTNEDFVLASPTRVPAVQMPLPSPSQAPASEDDTAIKPVDSVSNHEAASGESLRTRLGITSPRTVNISPAIPLSDTVLLFRVAYQDKSEEGVSTNNSPIQTPTSQLTFLFQILLCAGLKRLRRCMEADLRIAAGNRRTPALLAMIWNIHFAMAPEYPLPLRNVNTTRFLNSREVASVFLNRYGAILWPDESQPAPHLIDRSLIHARDSTVDPSRYWEWTRLGESHPKKGSLTDLQISELGVRMTKFVGLVYDLPIKRRAGTDWTAVALVLDDAEVREETLGGRFEELPGELKRQVLRLD
jgi:hypothetical protein